MGRGQLAAKKARRKDQLTGLPDEIISTIISMLTLKEAVRMSVLSKQWRLSWTCHPDLWFDSANVLGSTVYYYNVSVSQSELEKQLQRRKFIERVNKILHQRWKGTKIDSFAVHFHLGKDSAPHIDQWIRWAMIKSVESIDIDLLESCIFMVDHASPFASDEYKFPIWLLAASGKKCSVKHLRLASCSLVAPPNSTNLTSLVTIQLDGVRISDEQLEMLLSRCSFLEGLNLHLCNDLINLNVTGPNLCLKHLSVLDCFRLQKMELRATNLVFFEYTGHLISFYFKSVPKLAESFLSFTGDSRLDGAAYALTRFMSDVPQLETLNLVEVLAMKMLKLPETVSTFTNIKQLVLTVFPFDDEDKLCWISYVLKAFPLLQKLQLNLFCPSFIKQPKQIRRVLPECPHSHLSELEINGFYGNQHEEALLSYLLDNLVKLKVVAVSPRQKVYRGFNNWVYEEANSWYKFRMDRVCEWLRAVVPPTVLLQIR